MNELDKLTCGIRTGTFLVDPIFFKILDIDSVDTELTISEKYQFENKEKFINLLKKSGKSETALLLSESIYSRELFHIPESFYKTHNYLYDEEEDGLLFTENGNKFYLTGGF